MKRFDEYAYRLNFSYKPLLENLKGEGPKVAVQQYKLLADFILSETLLGSALKDVFNREIGKEVIGDVHIKIPYGQSKGSLDIYLRKPLDEHDEVGVSRFSL